VGGIDGHRELGSSRGSRSKIFHLEASSASPIVHVAEEGRPRCGPLPDRDANGLTTGVFSSRSGRPASRLPLEVERRSLEQGLGLSTPPGMPSSSESASLRRCLRDTHGGSGPRLEGEERSMQTTVSLCDRRPPGHDHQREQCPVSYLL
jgi:hypothetical protein